MSEKLLEFLDPTFHPRVAAQGMARRPDTLDGKVVGLIANDKLNAAELLDAVYDVLSERFEAAGFVSVNKGDAGRPAPSELLCDVSGKVDVAVLANGD